MNFHICLISFHKITQDKKILQKDKLEHHARVGKIHANDANNRCLDLLLSWQLDVFVSKETTKFTS